LDSITNSISRPSFYTDFLEITKARLAISVLFSSIAGFLLGIPNYESLNWLVLVKLAVGGYCMVGASNAFNQVIEKDLDSLMDRTKNRPVPSGRMSSNKALVIASLLTLVGLVLLFTINPKSALFGAISIFLYTSVYTPLKTVTPLSVFVGAFPGAIPFMLGWVAATNDFGIEAGTLFLIQFFWQFPHFWAIGYVAHRKKRQINCVADNFIYRMAVNRFVTPCFGIYGPFIYISNCHNSCFFTGYLDVNLCR
jgi:protoheme IX farnesyltransferase